MIYSEFLYGVGFKICLTRFYCSSASLSMEIRPEDGLGAVASLVRHGRNLGRCRDKDF